MSLVAALSRVEGFGLTVLEAMASGCAVLASEAGAWKDIVRDGIDGHLVPCNDPDATGAALASLLANPDRLATMGRSGRQRVEEHYTIERESSALVEYYRSLREGS